MANTGSGTTATSRRDRASGWMFANREEFFMSRPPIHIAIPVRAGRCVLLSLIAVGGAAAAVSSSSAVAVPAASAPLPGPAPYTAR